jgi:hypothetical protein
LKYIFWMCPAAKRRAVSRCGMPPCRAEALRRCLPFTYIQRERPRVRESTSRKRLSCDWWGRGAQMPGAGSKRGVDAKIALFSSTACPAALRQRCTRTHPSHCHEARRQEMGRDQRPARALDGARKIQNCSVKRHSAKIGACERGSVQRGVCNLSVNTQFPQPLPRTGSAPWWCPLRGGTAPCTAVSRRGKGTPNRRAAAASGAHTSSPLPAGKV